METEYEATFLEVDKDEIRALLKSVGAQLIKPEFMQRREVFTLPSGHEIKGGWLRVRDEGDKITMSLKVVDGEGISSQKETQLKVDSFENASSLLRAIGCSQKSYQENRRELWTLDGVEITIDEWPYLEPFVEVEGHSEEEVMEVSKKLGFDYSKAHFGAVDTLYSQKYGVDQKIINEETPRITFEDKNPFIKG